MPKKLADTLSESHPELASEWLTDKNGDLTPDQIVAGSHKKVWWKCAKGPDHEWESTIVNRANGNGCPNTRKLSMRSSQRVKLVNG